MDPLNPLRPLDCNVQGSDAMLVKDLRAQLLIAARKWWELTGEIVQLQAQNADLDEKWINPELRAQQAMSDLSFAKEMAEFWEIRASDTHGDLVDMWKKASAWESIPAPEPCERPYVLTPPKLLVPDLSGANMDAPKQKAAGLRVRENQNAPIQTRKQASTAQAVPVVKSAPPVAEADKENMEWMMNSGWCTPVRDKDGKIDHSNLQFLEWKKEHTEYAANMGKERKVRRYPCGLLEWEAYRKSMKKRRRGTRIRPPSDEEDVA